jgi:hypothetical protein
MRQDAQLEARPGHGRELEHRACPGSEARQALPDQVTDALRAGDVGQWADEPDAPVWDVEVSALEQVAPQLTKEQRIAARELADCRDQVGRCFGVGRAVDERRDVLGAERLASDPRLSVEERYGTHKGYVATHKGYVAAVSAAAANAVARGFLLQDDADALIAQAEASQVLL